MPRFFRLRVQLDETCHCTYYSSILIEPGDTVAVSTRFGVTTGKIVGTPTEVDKDPWKHGTAKQHVLENVTKKIYEKENVPMLGSKTVEVKHISSNRKGIFYTDLELSIGQIVVYEDGGIKPHTYEATKAKHCNDFPTDIDEDTANEIAPVGMHVGVVTNIDPDVVTANSWVVCVVDTTAHENRKVRMKQARKLMEKLNQKKKQFQDIELLRLIAASDPETKQMLDEYSALINNVPSKTESMF